MMSISMTLFGEITGPLRYPWQMLAEPWGSAEPRLKITASRSYDMYICV